MRLALYSLLLLSHASWACTTATLDRENGFMFGRTYDWAFEQANVTFNTRGLAKASFESMKGGVPLQWVSRYASLTFNQYGHEMPMGGMNEAGLVVETMWLDETTYLAESNLPRIDNVQWVQYMLDTVGTVPELLDAQKNIHVVSGGASKLHYQVCDRSRDCAILEFLDGKLTVYRGGSRPIPVLTNSPYRDSLVYRAKSFKNPKTREAEILGSFNRFVIADSQLKATKQTSRDGLFKVLDAVSSPRILIEPQTGLTGSTVWQVIYDPEQGEVSWRTPNSNQKTRFVRFSDFAGSCKRGTAKLLNITTGDGNVAGNFADYTEAANRTLVEGIFKDMTDKGFLHVKIPPDAIDALVASPGKFPCIGD
jgi:choloylglycine hydrolase